MIRILGILLDIAIFCIIYSAMDKNIGYLKKVLIYAVGMEIELFISMLLMGYISMLMIVLTFGAFFVIGLIVILIVDKLNNRYLFERVPFVIIAVVIDIAVKYVATLLLGGYLAIGLI